MTVSNHKGLNNTFVTDTLGAEISTISPLKALGTKFPLFKQDDYSVVITAGTPTSTSSSLSLAGSSFSNLGFYDDSTNTGDSLIMTISSASNWVYEYETVDLTDIPIKNINCYKCAQPLFSIHTKTLTLSKNTYA